jgi:AraC family transcriptional regulator
MTDTASELAIEANILEMLVLASRARAQKTPGAPPPWLQRVHGILHDRLSEHICLSWLAEVACVHVGHLARVFREYYGCSIGEYVRQLRVEAACQDLSRSNKPISAIAATAGFYDQAHFTNVFKTHVGVTPGQFRASHRLR